MVTPLPASQLRPYPDFSRAVSVDPAPSRTALPTIGCSKSGLQPQAPTTPKAPPLGSTCFSSAPAPAATATAAKVRTAWRDGAARGAAQERQREPGSGGDRRRRPSAGLVPAAGGQTLGARLLSAALPRAAPVFRGGAAG